MDHPSEDTLKRFASGTASREENRAVVVHLLKGCAACTRKLRLLMEPESVVESSYDAALDRLDERGLDHLETTMESDRPLREDSCSSGSPLLKDP